MHAPEGYVSRSMCVRVCVCVCVCVSVCVSVSVCYHIFSDIAHLDVTTMIRINFAQYAIISTIFLVKKL